MLRYHRGTRVDVGRYFVLGGVHYSEIEVGGATSIVPTSELSEERIIEDTPLIKIVDVLPPFDEVEGVSAPDNEVFTTTVSNGVDSSTFEKIVLEKDEPVEAKETVIATSKAGKKTKLGNRLELSESPSVKRLKLDPEAIQRCLNEVQKQHKGYTFKLENK